MALSDMMEHYKQIKKQYNDCIIFYRLGDFYEMFFEDAILVSGLLELTLTSRACGTDEQTKQPMRAPMCGIPYHAADEYIARLVKLGHRVAICEQLTEPTKGKQLVERDVIRIVTAGTLIKPEQIDEKSNNFICSVYFSIVKKSGALNAGESGAKSAEGGNFGGKTNEKVYAACAWADITTGEFFAREVYCADDLYDLLTRVSPSEVISDDQGFLKLKAAPVFAHKVLPSPSRYTDSAYSYQSARRTLSDQFKVRDLSAFDVEEKPEIICASGALVEYLKETQKRAVENVSSINIERSGENMQLDATALKNLEIIKSSRDGREYGTLLWVIDQTKTAMGARALKNAILLPLNDKERINARLDGVESLYKNMVVLSAIREELCGVKDIERIAGNVSNGNVTPKDMETLWHSLAVIPTVKINLSGFSCQALENIRNSLSDESELVELLRRGLKENCPVNYKDGDFIAEGFDENLDRLRNLKQSGDKCLKEIETRERDRTGIKNLKISYNRVFGYYIEVSNSFKDKVPYDYIRKQTLVGGERYITEELKKFEDEILSAQDRALRLELEIFEKFKGLLVKKIETLKTIAKAFASLDVLCSFAYVSKKYDYVRPEIIESDKPLDIVGGRHPVVERIGKERFIANDTLLDCDENNMMVITGPNMAGKSTYMRQVALITIMAHVGCFVPARSARVPLTDRVFTRVGASDNLIFDQSTFMVEMSEVALILRAATKKSLLVLDEVGRGTSTYDGLSIAWAVVEYICKKVRAKTLFATHYHELSELEGVLEGVKNYKITVKEVDGGILFLRKIMRGSANRSFGIEVAALAGVPGEVTARAKVILKRLEKNDLAKNGDALLSCDEAAAYRCEENGTSGENSSRGTASAENTFDNYAFGSADGEKRFSEVEAILKDVCVDDLTPRQAFDLVCELKEKLK
ncbi:MAG: DNA mismatch repair protein MutS [Candidatus Borkfalkiaceae bacterium]|nr:DNA mismatch repair protein MutS [Christensenellaceae bacterium]